MAKIIYKAIVLILAFLLSSCFSNNEFSEGFACPCASTEYACVDGICVHRASMMCDSDSVFIGDIQGYQEDECIKKCKTLYSIYDSSCTPAIDSVKDESDFSYKDRPSWSLTNRLYLCKESGALNETVDCAKYKF